VATPPKAEFLAAVGTFLGERLSSVPGPGDELIDSGRLDSLTILELYLFVEELHGEPIPPEQASLDDLRTLDAAYRLLERLAPVA
jgi:acyl carrier protein